MFAALTSASRLKLIHRLAAIGCGAPDVTTIVSEPRTAPSLGMTYLTFGTSSYIWYTSPDQAWVMSTSFETIAPMSSVVYVRRSGFCSSSSAAIWSSSASSVVFGSSPSRKAATAKASR